MTRLDRYILRQLGWAFGFFLLIFTGVIWLTQSVRLIETVIASGQSPVVFIEFSILILPTVMAIVLPLACFAAALFVINKLYSESELVVMMMSGQSPIQLARPIFFFSMIIALATFLIMVLAVPFGAKRLSERQFDIRTELARALIVEGKFLYPIKGVTLFIRDTSQSGEMAGLFLHDARDAERPVTYSANRAILLRDEESARLVMARGVALTYDTERGALNQVRFNEFTYDLSSLITAPQQRRKRPREFSLGDLMNPTEAMLASSRYDRGDYLAEGHQKLTTTALALLLPLLGLGVMMQGGYSRRGFGRRVFFASAAGVVVIALTFFSKTFVARLPDFWIVAYAPVIAGFVAFLWMIRKAGTPPRPPKEAAPA